MVADYLNNTRWQLQFRRKCNDWEVDDISRLLGLLEPVTLGVVKSDSMICLASKKGMFAVTSSYMLPKKHGGSLALKIDLENKSMSWGCLLWMDGTCS